MLHHLVTAPQPKLACNLPRTARPNAAPQDNPAARSATDRDFLAMLGQYRSSGGLARIAEVVALIERDLGKDAGQLERWRADRCVICFEWQAQWWLPRFQFASTQVLPNPAVALVLAELNNVLDDCEVAQWFAAGNASLTGLAPVDLIGQQPTAVLRAAQDLGSAETRVVA